MRAGRLSTMGGAHSRRNAFRALDEDHILNTAPSGLDRRDPAQVLLEQERVPEIDEFLGRGGQWECSGSGWSVSVVRAEGEDNLRFVCKWDEGSELIMAGSCSSNKVVLLAQRTQVLAGQAVDQGTWVHTQHADVGVGIIPEKVGGATVLTMFQEDLGVQAVRIPYCQIGMVLLRFQICACS